MKECKDHQKGKWEKKNKSSPRRNKMMKIKSNKKKKKKEEEKKEKKEEEKKEKTTTTCKIWLACNPSTQEAETEDYKSEGSLNTQWKPVSKTKIKENKIKNIM